MFTFLSRSEAGSATPWHAAFGQTRGKEPQLRDDIARDRQYELMAIFTPEVPEEDLVGEVDRVSEIIGAAGGNVTLINRESPWGRRRLSYPIRHNGRDVRDGIYVLFYADINTQSISEIERDLKLMTSLMRYLVTQQVAEQMIPESMKPDDESIAGITADGEPAPPVTAVDATAATDEAAAVDAAAVTDETAAEGTADATAEPVVAEVATKETSEETSEAVGSETEPASAESAEESTVSEEPAVEAPAQSADESPTTDADESGEDTGSNS